MSDFDRLVELLTSNVLAKKMFDALGEIKTQFLTDLRVARNAGN
jgi:hypothetical protein